MKVEKGAGEKGRITRAASVVGLSTAASRVLGYVRDAVIAAFFGATLHADAFFVAYRVSNLLRRLVGEGALTSAVVPIFTEELGSRTKEEARALVGRLFTLFFIILLVLMVLGVLFSGPLIKLLAPGFTIDPAKFDLTVSLTQALFPYMVFIGLVAIAMGVLNSMRHFFAPAVSPVLFNLAIIVSALVVSPFLNEPVYALVAGVLLGGLLQLLFHLPYLSRVGMLPTMDFNFSDPALRKIFALMGPAVIGVGIYQLNILVTMRFASQLAEGSVAYLYYAGRLMELPLGVFAVAVSTAVLPSLSTYAAEKDFDSMRESVSFSLKAVNFVIIPATFGLIILSLPIIEVLFQRGEFGATAAEETAFALYFYAAGLVPVACSRVLVSVFYSLKDTKTPVRAGVVSFFVNLVMCLVLMGPLRHGGLALATTISATVNFLILAFILRGKLGGLGDASVGWSALKCTVSSLLMAAVVYALYAASDWSGYGIMGRAAFLAGYIFAGIFVYSVSSKLLKVEEYGFLKGLLAEKLKRRRGVNE